MERKELIVRVAQVMVLLIIMWVMIMNKNAIERQRDDYLYDKTQSWVEICANVCPAIDSYSMETGIGMSELINNTHGIDDLKEIIFKTGGGICLPSGRERELC